MNVNDILFIIHHFITQVVKSNAIAENIVIDYIAITVQGIGFDVSCHIVL